jgi:hypothetical protein
MITLSFILVSNVFFLALLVRQALIAHPSILNWEFIASLLRVNLVYVSLIPRVTDADHTRFPLEMYLQHLFSSSFDPGIVVMEHDRFGVRIPCVQGRSPPPSPLDASKIRYPFHQQIKSNIRSNNPHST